MAEQHPRIFWTADRSALVEEGDVRAAFLAYGTADPIAPEHLALLQDKQPLRAAPVRPVAVPRKTTPRKSGRR